MKPIETVWKGYRFRSRTEARWAVMFDAAREPYEYEKQGFELPSGPYLPDFWLRERKLWVEVKGEQPTQREIDLASELSSRSRQMVIFAVGPPDPDRFEYPVASLGRLDWTTTIHWPDSAMRTARAERFDGKPTRAQSTQRLRWW